VQQVAIAWPIVDVRDSVVTRAIQNSINNLAHYPHGRADEMRSYVAGGDTEIARVLAKWSDAA